MLQAWLVGGDIVNNNGIVTVGAYNTNPWYFHIATENGSNAPSGTNVTVKYKYIDM